MAREERDGPAQEPGRGDVFSLRTFLALRNGEAYALTFGKGLEAASNDLLEVCKYVRT